MLERFGLKPPALRPDAIMDGLINCHVVGLHSLILTRNPVIRVFFTTPGHSLHSLPSARHIHGIAIHPHHCDIRLMPLYGTMWNHVYRRLPIDRINEGSLYKYWLYDSHIRDGVGGFTGGSPTRKQRLVESANRLKYPVSMPAECLHSVTVDGPRAAWLVVEGAEAPTPMNYAFSNAHLENWTPKGLYKLMTRSFLDEQFFPYMQGNAPY